MDICSISPSTRTVDIVSPASAEAIGLKIELRPASAPEIVRVKRAHTNEALKNRGKVSAEKMEANALDVLVAATAGWEWSGDLTFRDAKPDATPENIRRVYKELTWVRAQIDDALGDEAAFFLGDEGSAG